jgi:hypothetical protein
VAAGIEQSRQETTMARRWEDPEGGEPMTFEELTRFVCTKEEPWTPERGRRAAHPAAEHLRDRDYGDGESTAVYRCPYCDLTFEEELAQ